MIKFDNLNIIKSTNIVISWLLKKKKSFFFLELTPLNYFILCFSLQIF